MPTDLLGWEQRARQFESLVEQSKRRELAESRRADQEATRADAERQRADTEAKRADDERRRAEAEKTNFVKLQDSLRAERCNSKDLRVFAATLKDKCFGSSFFFRALIVYGPRIHVLLRQERGDRLDAGRLGRRRVAGPQRRHAQRHPEQPRGQKRSEQKRARGGWLQPRALLPLRSTAQCCRRGRRKPFIVGLQSSFRGAADHGATT